MQGRNGQLYLNDRLVGRVAIHGWHDSWGVGDFAPEPAFEEFAPLFAEWSRLMHADVGPLSAEHAERLREIEFRMYALRAKLWIEQLRQWRVIRILTIDGAMIEWKEGWSQRRDVPPEEERAEEPSGAPTEGEGAERFLG